MMTILVVFLLAHTAEVDILPNTKNISIPQSISERKPGATVVVMVTKDSVFVDGQLVGSLSDVIANQGPFFAPLKNALVAQNPTKMGYEAVKAMVATLHGEKVPQNVDSGVALITPENVDTPEIQELLK